VKYVCKFFTFGVLMELTLVGDYAHVVAAARELASKLGWHFHSARPYGTDPA
jgi:hypothetical protein